MDEQLATAQHGRVAERDAPVEDTEQITFTTVRFGEVTVDRTKVLHFPRGLVGLPEAQRFVFLHASAGRPDDEASGDEQGSASEDPAEGPFFWLQSADDPALAFVVCEPQAFFPGYVAPLTSEEQSLLSVQRPEDGLVCLILVIPQDPQKITANLRGPLVVNPNLAVGIQLVLTGDEYPTRAPLFPVGPSESLDRAEGGGTCSF